MKKIYITTILILFAFSGNAYSSGWNSLKSPFPVFATLPNENISNTKDTKCPEAPPAVHDLEYTSVYTDKSDGVSKVDKKAQKKYRGEVADIRHYETRLYKWLDNAFDKKADETNQTTCIMNWLSYWADNNSLLDGNTNFQGEAVRKWTLASLSSLYLQIKNINGLDNSQKKRVERWLDRIASQVVSDYEQYPDSKSRNNNHMYWAAWAVMVTGIATNKNDFYKWGLEQYKQAIDDIEDDGTLPLETFRQSKAFLYHSFAAAPLVMMAETATRNGRNMYDYNDGKIHKLVALITNELDNGQSYLKQKTGKKQDVKDSITSSHLAWMEVYNARFHNPDIERWLAKLRPMIQRRIGGNMTALYNSSFTEEKNR